MTIEDLINRIGILDTRIILLLFFLPVGIAWVSGRLHGPYNGWRSPWKYIYAVLVYLVCIPGIFSAVITAYALFIVRQNLMQVNFVVYFIPIISMAATLMVIDKNVPWNQVPGFDRLYALMILIAVSFMMALVILKTRIWIFFGGSVWIFIIASVVCFLILKGCLQAIRGKRNRP